jgi:hypothetical protein
MTIEEIKAAVNAGKAVHWQHAGYRVIKDGLGQYLIQYTPNMQCIGLTNLAGDKLNGDPDKFFVV